MVAFEVGGSDDDDVIVGISTVGVTIGIVVVDKIFGNIVVVGSATAG